MTLRAGQLDMATVAAQAPVPWAVLDVEGRHVLANEAYCELFGLVSDAVAGCPVTTLLDATGLLLLEERRELLGSDGTEPLRTDVRYRRADGRSFLGALASSVLRDQAGAPIGTVDVVTDVTAQRAIAAALEHSERRLDRMLASLSERVVLVDAAGRTHDPFAAVARDEGQDPQRGVALDFASQLHPDDTATTTALWEEVRATPGLRRTVELRVADGEGGWEDLEVTAVNLLDEQAVDAVMFIVRKVTRRKRAERELRALRDVAVDQAQQRTAFVANVSHELRNPLHAVLGLAELLTEHIDGDPGLRLLAALRREASRLREIADDLLDVSRVDADGLTLHIGPVELPTLVARVIERITPMTDPSRVRLTGRVSEDTARWVLSDAHRLDQVLTNLVSNAAKFTQDGSVDLAVDTPVPDRLRITVTDTGPGVPAAYRERVFEPFAQVPGEHAARGSGLGLALVKRLAQVLGGNVVLDCPAGGGTVVTVELEARPTSHSEAAPAEATAAVAQGGDNRPLHVLVVEDDPTNQLLVSGQLSRLGHRFTLVDRAEAALELLSPDHDVDLVLMDWQLPDLDGLEATRRLRSAEAGSGRHVPVVALTASAMPEDQAASRDAGMDDFVAKPASLQDLATAVERCRSRRPAEGSAPSFAEQPVVRDGSASVDAALLQLESDLGDPAPVLALVDRYLEQLDERHALLRAATDEGDLGTFHRIGHALRATSQMLGVLDLRDRCRELEALDDPAEIPSVMRGFGIAAHRAHEELRGWARKRETS